MVLLLLLSVVSLRVLSNMHNDSLNSIKILSLNGKSVNFMSLFMSLMKKKIRKNSALLKSPAMLLQCSEETLIGI